MIIIYYTEDILSDKMFITNTKDKNTYIYQFQLMLSLFYVCINFYIFEQAYN